MKRHIFCTAITAGIVLVSTSALASLSLFSQSVTDTHIHVTQFQTSGHVVTTQQTAAVGFIDDAGSCNVKKSTRLSPMQFKDGDIEYLNGEAINMVFGGKFTCFQMTYRYGDSKVVDSFKLIWHEEKGHYTATDPAFSVVKLT